MYTSDLISNQSFLFYIVSSTIMGQLMHQKSFGRTSLEVQGLRLLPLQGVQFQSLVWELGSYMPRGQRTKALKKKKEKQYYNKFNKDF